VSTREYGTEADLLGWTYGGTVTFGAPVGSGVDLEPWSYPSSVGFVEYDSYGDYVLIQMPPGAVESSYINRVWDPLAMDYVRWVTYYIDVNGQEYPGPSLWAAVSGSYVVEAIKFGRIVA
jgi:hypothetical protein